MSKVTTVQVMKHFKSRNQYFNKPITTTLGLCNNIWKKILGSVKNSKNCTSNRWKMSRFWRADKLFKSINKEWVYANWFYG